MKMEEVNIQVDMTRRNRLKRLHTTTHIINYCAKQVLGNHVWQNGSNLRTEIGTLDITHYDQLSFEEIKKIEDMANEIVFEDKKVGVEELDRTSAEKKYGFELYQGGAIPMKNLRIVHVGEFDTQACGGLHVYTTSGIGIIKLVDAQKIQDGVIRLSYVVREYALDLIHQNEEILNNTSNLYSVQKKHLEKTAGKFFNEWRKQKKEIEKLNDSIKDLAISNILNSTDKEFTLPIDDMKSLTQIMEECIDKKSTLKIKSEKFLLATQDISVENYKKQIPKNKYTLYIL